MSKKAPARGNRYHRTRELTEFGRRLRNLISASDLRTRSAFLEETGIPHSTLYRYETISEAAIPSQSVAKMAAALGVSSDALLGLPSNPQEALRAQGHAFSAARVEEQWALATQAAQRLRGHLSSGGPLPLGLVDFLLSHVGSDVELVRAWRAAERWRRALDEAKGDEAHRDARRRLTAHLMLLVEEIAAYASNVPLLVQMGGEKPPRLLLGSGERFDPQVPDPSEES